MPKKVLLVVGDVVSIDRIGRVGREVHRLGLGRPKVVRVGSFTLSGVPQRFEEAVEASERDGMPAPREDEFARDFFREVTGVDLEDVVGYVADNAAHTDERNVFLSEDSNFFEAYLGGLKVRRLAHYDGRIEEL